ncbi:MAG: hypothetical protein JWR69_2789 [Pedosphaera sp.]|nr:hypothetical protein [Pedosphaera sp.]
MGVQDWIHRFEEGNTPRYLKYALLYALLLAVLLGIVAGYNYRGFRNMANPEAMDAAQLGRNIAEHQGYKTLFVRPFSMYLVQKANAEKLGPAPLGDLSDRSQIRTMHPDLANPPVYPLLLAGLMKVVPPCRSQVTAAPSIWNRGGQFGVYAPDFYISLFNQSLFLLAIVLLFFLARRLFDSAVAWTSAFLFLSADLFWRFSMSGLSTMLVIVIFLALLWCLVLLEQNAREAKWSQTAVLTLAAVIGALVALGALTRYSFGWLILPVVVFLILFLGRQRVTGALVALSVFALVLAPWVARNYHLSHTLFGTAGFAIYETVSPFTEFRLDRSLKPDFVQVQLNQIWFKFVANLRIILQDDLPKMGGNWVTAFFLVGLLVGFRNPSLSRLRWFTVLCLPVLIIVQALGKTHLSVEYPVVNSENLLVLVAPVLIIFGVGLFFTLLEQMKLPLKELRYLVIGVFGFVACLPMLLIFLSPRPNVVAYPPYFPPIIQETAGWMKPDELMMSDIPWAVAWYGQRQCVWLTLNAQEDFYNIHDYQKPVNAVYLTPETMDKRLLAQWFRAKEGSWDNFIMGTLTKKELPPYFPLRKMPGGFLPEQLFITDRERWVQGAGN